MEWQTIDSAPKDGTRIDVWVPYSYGAERVADAFWCKGGRYEPEGWYGPYEEYAEPGLLDPQPTHWLPLPPPPKVID